MTNNNMSDETKFVCSIKKSTTVTLRMTPETKVQIQVAARHVGKTASDFMVDSVRKEIAKVLQTQPDKLDIWRRFKSMLDIAKDGGTNGYNIVGLELARLIPFIKSNPGEEWLQKIDMLWSLVYGGDDDAVVFWFKRYLPEYIRLVPERRYRQFVSGVRQGRRDAFKRQLEGV
jgi:uncharacterized protein (DUF1778 family)